MGRTLPLVAALLALALAGPRAGADNWSGFYRPSPATAEARAESVCLAEILSAEARYDIPDNLLLAIGVQEAGRNISSGLTVWPWAVNASGEGVFFATQAEAMEFVQLRKRHGVRSIDVGCMQVNQHWHGRAFDDLEHAFNPRANVDYAARFLLALYKEERDWHRAAGRYHSSTPDLHETYLGKLKRNIRYVAEKLPHLTALASASSVRRASEQPAPTVFWTASGGGDAAQYSIYSNQPMNPVLPVYRNGS